VPETRLTPADLLRTRRRQPGTIRRWRCLIYVMLIKLLGWIVLRARADTAGECEGTAVFLRLPRSGNRHDLGRHRHGPPLEPTRRADVLPGPPIGSRRRASSC
jgi:hypothetical protein